MARNLVLHVESRSTKGKQQWAIEKRKLDNPRKLKGIYFFDPDAKEFKQTIKNTRKMLEIPMDAAMQEFISLSHYNLVHKFVPMPQAMKIPDAEAAVDKEWRSSKSCQLGN